VPNGDRGTVKPPLVRLSAGVHLQNDGRAHARVWAPACRTLEFVVGDRGDSSPSFSLTREADGYFSGFIPSVSAGNTYWFRLDGKNLRPDPSSRYQPEGPHGPSVIVDPDAFKWTDADWPGLTPAGQVLYEMHVGTFTPEGTWASAAAQLESLVELGITAIEMMPVHDFAGQFGWGYDGVDLYAPTRLYGRPDDLRRFVNRAHAVGLGVILDVVYNHLGPDGNYLEEFAPEYFTDRYTNDWGRALNFEGPAGARRFFVENAGYWIDEFHFDGLRFDATQDMHDASDEHVIAAMVRRAREAAGSRSILLIAENEPQHARIVNDPTAGGYGMDALWNDDYHHAATVALTGRREAYYLDYTGSPQELVSCAKYGYLYQGQWYIWQEKGRGTPALDLPPTAFISYLQNHDQVANSPFGRRIHQLASPGRHRALTALTLLGPWTPMLFQGQEFSASTPFLYFADHPGLRDAIAHGRREFLQQFPSLKDPEIDRALPSPTARETFEQSHLKLEERSLHADAYALHQDLLKLRRSNPVIRQPRRVDGAVLSANALALRLFGESGDRLLCVNLGADLDLRPVAEPLLAPPSGGQWRLLWSSESARYGGQGTPPLNLQKAWHVPGEAAILLGYDTDHEQ
jgi:maltooligosyltrehalose trehalohydrolase